MVTIVDLVSVYERNHTVSRTTRGQLYHAARLYSRHVAGGTATPADFHAEAVNAWLASRLRVCRPHTVYSQRGHLVMLWREAHRLGLCATAPAGVMRIKRPELRPRALLREEIVALLAAADRLDGVFCTGQSRRLWARSLLLAAYDTALRLGDLLSLEVQDVLAQHGRLTIVQRKTGHQHTVRMRPETLAVIGELVGRRRTGPVWLIWGTSARPDKCVHRLIRTLRKRAGLDAGGLQAIRRASASYVEAVQPGAGAKHLGHRSAGLAERYYLDPRIVPRETYLPPALET